MSSIFICCDYICYGGYTMKNHGIYFMGRKTEIISMGHCKARFINNQSNGTYTIIFKYHKGKDCKNHSRVLLEKINEAKKAYKGNRYLSIEENWLSISITNAMDNGINMVVYMEDADLMLELDYISYISEEDKVENGNTKRSE